MEKIEKLMLLLTHIKGIGPKKIELITNMVKSIEELSHGFDEICKITKIDRNTQVNFEKIMNNLCIEETIFNYKAKNISIISKFNHLYPKLLKEIYDPPQILFCKGNINLLINEHNLAIVGARKATWYGKNIARQLGEYLSGNDYTVTSGMARGIDTEAHLGALEGTAGSIGVLGCGIDVIYPRQNKDLYEKMEEKGLLVSVYPMGTEPLAGHFPARNRIISGLSKGVIVVEAETKSGALITVDFAMEQGRDVFAVPGNINSITSSGTNKLIKDGAVVVTKPSDILEEYGQMVGSKSEAGLPPLTETEKKILSATGGQSVTLEYILLVSGLDISVILATLVTLEIKGLIKKMGNQMYQPVVNVDF